MLEEEFDDSWLPQVANDIDSEEVPTIADFSNRQFFEDDAEVALCRSSLNYPTFNL